MSAEILARSGTKNSLVLTSDSAKRFGIKVRLLHMKLDKICVKVNGSVQRKHNCQVKCQSMTVNETNYQQITTST